MLHLLALSEGGWAFSWKAYRVPLTGKSIPRRFCDI